MVMSSTPHFSSKKIVKLAAENLRAKVDTKLRIEAFRVFLRLHRAVSFTIHYKRTNSTSYFRPILSKYDEGSQNFSRGLNLEDVLLSIDNFSMRFRFVIV